MHSVTRLHCFPALFTTHPYRNGYADYESTDNLLFVSSHHQICFRQLCGWSNRLDVEVYRRQMTHRVAVPLCPVYLCDLWSCHSPPDAQSVLPWAKGKDERKLVWESNGKSVSFPAVSVWVEFTILVFECKWVWVTVSRLSLSSSAIFTSWVKVLSCVRSVLITVIFWDCLFYYLSMLVLKSFSGDKTVGEWTLQGKSKMKILLSGGDSNFSIALYLVWQ